MLDPPRPDVPRPDAPLPDAVDRALRSFFAERRAQTERVSPHFAEAVGSLEAFVLRGGKRVRPSFAWWGWRGAGGDPNGPSAPAVLRACAALELIQACALVHDDLMDASATRRGHATVHTEFAARHRAQDWGGDPHRFGMATAVLLGDIALAWADDMLGTVGLAPESGARAYWNAMRIEMLGGQYLDVLTEVRGEESPEAALRISRFKTAAYTVERPLQFGGALAGASPELLDAYRRFGREVGVAFQLRDDLLGVFGDPAVTGKPAGDDLREGKRTLLVAVALQRADAAAAATLRAALGRDLDDATLDRLRALLVDVGAVREVEDRIATLTERGLAALETDLIDPVAAAELRAMATAVAVRAS